MNEIVKVDAQPIEPAPTTRAPIQKLTKAQVDVLKNTICRGANDDELKAFIWCCERTGLDPFRKQIHAFKSGNNLITHTGIDGYRLIASRSGKYLGRIGPQWCGDDGKWVEVWLDRKDPPSAARVGVRHRDFPEPIYAVATLASFGRRSGGGHLTGPWADKTDVMLAKCAESAAIRAAFPEDCSGIYSDDEVDSVREDPATVLMSIRAQIEDGIAKLKDRGLAAKASGLYRNATAKGDLEGVLSRLKVELARQADSEKKSQVGGGEAPSPEAPAIASGTPSSPSPAPSTPGAQAAGPGPQAAPATASTSGGSPATTAVEPGASSARATGPAPSSPGELPFGQEKGDAYDGDLEPVHVPTVDEVLSKIGKDHSKLARDVVTACAKIDEVALVSTSIGDVLQGYYGADCVNGWWSTAGGLVQEIREGKKVKERVRRAISVRELLEVLELAPVRS